MEQTKQKIYILELLLENKEGFTIESRSIRLFEHHLDAYEFMIELMREDDSKNWYFRGDYADVGNFEMVLYHKYNKDELDNVRSVKNLEIVMNGL